MTKRVLDVGNCGPDFGTISQFLADKYGCDVDQAHGAEDTLAALRSHDYALVLVNRKLDRDYSDGIEIIRQMKADEALRKVPVMLVTNYPEHQDAAEQAGAVYWYQSDGATPPSFTEHTVSSDVASADAVFVADVDHDGSVDVLSASSVPGSVSDNDKVAWHRNDGALTPSWTETVIDSTTEGLNALIKKVKRIAAGFRRFDHYRLRVLLYTGGCNWNLLGQHP